MDHTVDVWSVTFIAQFLNQKSVSSISSEKYILDMIHPFLVH